MKVLGLPEWFALTSAAQGPRGVSPPVHRGCAQSNDDLEGPARTNGSQVVVGLRLQEFSAAWKIGEFESTLFRLTPWLTIPPEPKVGSG